MPHKITPIFNGITNIRFKHRENESLPDFENIPHFIYLITIEDNKYIIVDTGFDINYVPGMNSDGSRDKDFDIPHILQSMAIKSGILTKNNDNIFYPRKVSYQGK